MPFARKKPVAIEYVVWDGTWEQAADVVAFCKGAARETLPPTGRYLVIDTLEGDMKVSPGDHIIKGVHGEFYPCKPDIFLATYDLIADDFIRET